MTEMMDSEQFGSIKADLPLEAMPVKGGSPYDMTDTQKKLAQYGQKIKASLSPRSSDVQWPDDQEWLDALKLSDAMIGAGPEDGVADVLKRVGMAPEKAKAIMDKIKAGNVDVTKSGPDPEADADGVAKLAQAIKKA